jgi:hypothetical protein
MKWYVRVTGRITKIGIQAVDDILVALQAAHSMANKLNRPFALMDDLSVQEVTMYTEIKAIEIIHPVRKDYVRSRDGQREHFAN